MENILLEVGRLWCALTQMTDGFHHSDSSLVFPWMGCQSLDKTSGPPEVSRPTDGKSLLPSKCLDVEDDLRVWPDVESPVSVTKGFAFTCIRVMNKIL